MQLQPRTQAIDFEATQLNGKKFKLSDHRGSKMLLSFFRNGACAMCNLRIHELIQRYPHFEKAGIKIIAVFESPIEDMEPYVAQQHAPFVLLADPTGLLYSLYHVEISADKISHVIQSNLAEERIKEAATKGFPLMKQPGSNFNRLPADFLIGQNFQLQQVHYSNFVIDHLPLESILDKEW
jgi:thioredoxin-dependent peroxiredoxin